MRLGGLRSWYPTIRNRSVGGMKKTEDDPKPVAASKHPSRRKATEGSNATRDAALAEIAAGMNATRKAQHT